MNLLPRELYVRHLQDARVVLEAVEQGGSVLRDDFGPHSDVDLIADFEDDAPWSVLEHVMMEEDLAAIFGRRVDLVSRDAITAAATGSAVARP